MTLIDFKAEVAFLKQDKSWVPREICIVADGKKYDIVQIHNIEGKFFIIETKKAEEADNGK